MVRRGYTLLEACIVMLIVSIFVAVIANVVPHKVKPKTEKEPHGRFECYYNSEGKLTQSEFIEGKDSEIVDVDNYCTFVVPPGIKYIIINAVGGGAGKLSDGLGTTGKFLSTFYSSSDKTYKIKLGEAGTSADVNGGSTIIYEYDADGWVNDAHIVLEAVGGTNTNGDKGVKNTLLGDVISCFAEVGEQLKESSSNVLAAGFACSRSPVCEIEGDRLKVSFCRSNELYKTTYIPWKRTGDASESSLRDSQFVADSPYTEWNPSSGKLVYHDSSLWTDYGNEPPSNWRPCEKTYDADGEEIGCESDTNTDRESPSLYTLTLKLNSGIGSENESLMSQYIKMLKIEGGIAGVKPGDRATNSSDASPGAVLIMW